MRGWGDGDEELSEINPYLPISLPPYLPIPIHLAY